MASWNPFGRGGSSELGAKDFELSDESAKSIRSDPVQDSSSFFGRLLRRASSDVSSERSSVLFDSEDAASETTMDSIETPPSTLASAPFSKSTSPRSPEERTLPEPARSGLTLLSRIRAHANQGEIREEHVHAAIRHEVAARQQQKVEAFARDLEQSGAHVAVENAIKAVTDQGRAGRAESLDARPLIKRLGQGNHREAASAVLGEIQSHYHGAAESGVGAKAIAANFAKNVANGTYSDAAEITRVMVEAHHDFIHANEMNAGAARPSASSAMTSASNSAKAAPASSRHYDERARDARAR